MCQDCVLLCVVLYSITETISGTFSSRFLNLNLQLKFCPTLSIIWKYFHLNRFHLRLISQKWNFIGIKFMIFFFFSSQLSKQNNISWFYRQRTDSVESKEDRIILPLKEQEQVASEGATGGSSDHLCALHGVQLSDGVGIRLLGLGSEGKWVNTETFGSLLSHSEILFLIGKI